MAEKKNSDTTTQGTKKTTSTTDVGQAEVQQIVDQENEQGYRGTATDPTPNDNYTVSGVTSGAPTPETDANAFTEANAAVRGKTGIEENA
jgi:hypothetical protein